MALFQYELICPTDFKVPPYFPSRLLESNPPIRVREDSDLILPNTCAIVEISWNFTWKCWERLARRGG